MDKEVQYKKEGWKKVRIQEGSMEEEWNLRKRDG